MARSHLTLARITGALEQLGVPLLYLGDLFEREEIRDLLALISIDAEPGGIGLVRVAQLPEYGASKSDALAVIKWAEDNNLRILDALRRLPEIPGLTRRAARASHVLANQVDELRTRHVALDASDDMAVRAQRLSHVAAGG